MEYTPKPNGYKTVNQWAKEGYRPKSSDVIHKYAATKWDGSLFLDEKGCPSVYNYVSPEDVVPIKQVKFPGKVTALGREMLTLQSNLAAEYGYRVLPKEVGEEKRLTYLQNLPSCFEKESAVSIQNETGHLGFETGKGTSFPLYTRNGTLIARGYDRVVIGDYGAFIEVDSSDMVLNNVMVKPGEEYRIEDPKFAFKVKYQWFTVNDNTDCKLYFQQRGVTYADYRPEKWYISPYEVLAKEELIEYKLPISMPRIKPVCEEKQNTLPSPDAYAVCFDTETTGFSPFKGAELLQITIADHSGILFSSYLHPYHSKEWKKAMEAHHITPDMVKDAPYPHEVAGIIRELFAKAEVITGHNLKFDLAFVEKCLRIKIPEEKIFDTYPFFKQDRPGGHHKLGDAVEYYCPEKLDFYKNGAHNAEIDTLSNMAVYEAIVEREKEINLKKNLKKNLEEDMEIE
jgi:DNA polymerase III epsilon subunit-like protein